MHSIFSVLPVCVSSDLPISVPYNILPRSSTERVSLLVYSYCSQLLYSTNVPSTRTYVHSTDLVQPSLLLLLQYYSLVRFCLVQSNSMASSKAAKIPNCTYTYRTVRVDTSYVHIHVYTKDTVLLQEVLLDPIVYTHTLTLYSTGTTVRKYNWISQQNGYRTKTFFLVGK